MNERKLGPGLSSISVIVNEGLSHKVTKYAKEAGALGHTVVLARGTVSNKLLELLGLNENRRELIFILAENHLAEKILMTISCKLRFDKPGNGIAFCTELAEVRGMHTLTTQPSVSESTSDTSCEYGQKEEKMFQSIYVVVDKGKANEVISSAKNAGSRGGTIFNARGSGIHETSKLFSMEVEPEKEVVLILTEIESTDRIATAIVNDLNMNEPGNGVLYIQNVNMTYGLY